MIGYRIQAKAVPAESILDPEQQFSCDYSGRDELTRHGVSVCGSLEDLALYLASAGVEWHPDTHVLVECEGPRSEDEDVDHDAPGAPTLILPERILDVTEIDDEFYALLDAAFEAAFAA